MSTHYAIEGRDKCNTCVVADDTYLHSVYHVGERDSVI